MRHITICLIAFFLHLYYLKNKRCFHRPSKKPAKKNRASEEKNQNRASEEKNRAKKNHNCPAKKIIRFCEKNGDKKPSKKTDEKNRNCPIKKGKKIYTIKNTKCFLRPCKKSPTVKKKRPARKKIGRVKKRAARKKKRQKKTDSDAAKKT